jgi:transposase-like protein
MGRRLEMINPHIREQEVQAYSLYVQKCTYKEISQALGITEAQAWRRVLKYARRTKNPYPLPRRNQTGQYMYDLYLNGVSMDDIALLLGVKLIKVYRRMKAYCEAAGKRYPLHDYRGEDAYYLMRDHGMSYQVAAQCVGFTDRSNCYRSVKAFAQKNGLKMPKS